MKSRFLACAALTALSVTFSGCAKKVVAKAPAPPAPGRDYACGRVYTRQGPAPKLSQPSAGSFQSRRRACPTPPRVARIQDLLNRIQDAYFDYNKHTLRPDAEAALKTDAQTLADIIKQYPDFKLTVAGICRRARIG